MKIQLVNTFVVDQNITQSQIIHDEDVLVTATLSI